MRKEGGIKRKLWKGIEVFHVRFIMDGVTHRVGRYYSEKEAKKGHDMYVIKNNLKRRTYYLKKI